MIALILLLAYTAVRLSPQPEDEFIGRVVVEWLTEEAADRTMRLVEDFAYRDPAGKVWRVPAGAEINGASIPAALYSIIGPPFVGDYRRASVLHDYYCRQRTESWKAVHKMFYDAARTGKVALLPAKAMYAAVLGWGPRWEQAATRGGAPPTVSIPRPTPNSSDLLDLETWITDADPTLDEIDRRVSELLGQAAHDVDS